MQATMQLAQILYKSRQSRSMREVITVLSELLKVSAYIK